MISPAYSGILWILATGATILKCWKIAYVRCASGPLPPFAWMPSIAGRGVGLRLGENGCARNAKRSLSIGGVCYLTFDRRFAVCAMRLSGEPR